MAATRQPTPNREIGALIVAARHRVGLSQSDLARKLDVDPDHLGKIERGTQPATAERLKQIVDICNVRADWFSLSFEERDEVSVARKLAELTDSLAEVSAGLAALQLHVEELGGEADSP